MSTNLKDYLLVSQSLCGTFCVLLFRMNSRWNFDWKLLSLFMCNNSQLKYALNYYSLSWWVVARHSCAFLAPHSLHAFDSIHIYVLLKQFYAGSYVIFWIKRKTECSTLASGIERYYGPLNLVCFVNHYQIL